MFAQNGKISIRQLESMLLLSFFGTGVLFLPGELAQTAGQGCYWVALFWGMGATFVAVLLSVLGQRRPDFSPLDWYALVFGKGIGSGLVLGLCLKVLFDGALELRIFIEVISSAMLPKTPLWLLLGVMVLLCAFGARGGVECGARVGELLFFVVLLPLMVVLLAVAITTAYGRVLPVTLPSVGQTWQGGRFFAPVFQGLSLMVFAFPYLKQSKKGTVSKRLATVTVLATVLFTGMVFLSLAVYGAEVLGQRLLPTLQMMERVSFTGIFLGRQDLLLLWIWMASCFSYLTMALFFAGDTCRRVCSFHGKKGHMILWLGCLVVFILAVLPRDLAGAYALRLAIEPWTNGIFLVLLPLVLLIVDYGKRRKNHGA